MPNGRGIDGVYKKPPGEPPPPYVITETKYRTGGNYKPTNLPTTKGSKGYRRAKQMSDDWVDDRLDSAVGYKTAADINDEGFEKWLMVVDESGCVVDISKLDAKGDALLDAVGRPVKPAL